MKVAKVPIRFRQLGNLVNYKVGDTILPKHEQVINYYYSGQVEEREMFNIKHATIHINSNLPISSNPLEGIKASIENTQTAIKELSSAVKDLKKSSTKGSLENDKVKIVIDEITFVPQENIESEGNFVDTKTEGADIKYKIKKLKKVFEDKEND